MSTITAFPPGNTAAILRAAADYLTRYGWISAGLYDSHNACAPTKTQEGRRLSCPCHYSGTYPASIIGAIRYAVFGQPRWYLDTTDGQSLRDYTAAVEWFNTYLIAIGHAGRHASVFDWQSAPGRTAGQVSDALHVAAAYYRHRPARRAA